MDGSMDESVDGRWDGVIPAAGLTVLFNPPKPFLDIVFVHGFTGHPEKTWTHKRGDMTHRSEDKRSDELVEPPSKVRRLNLFSRPHDGGNSNTAVYWPRDLVPTTVPNARVLTFGYDTHLRHRYFGPSVSQSTVYDISWDFLVALEAKRRLESSRPLLFIAHSLGGIIVKEMLRRSSACHVGQTHLRNVFDSTTGIIFFGTPHGGADPRGFLQHIMEAAIEAAGVQVNKQIVNTLLPSSERLKELRDAFSPVAHQQNWMIHSFQEELGVGALNGRKVVEDTSSCLNISIEISEHIRQNHMDMCRFTGHDDTEYKKVAAAIHRMTGTISKQSRTAEVPPLSEEQRRTLLDSMRFDQIDARQMTIKKAHAKTCEWLLKMPEYLDWLDAAKLCEHHGFFWIKGKPGAGKSTIMKFALNNYRKIMKETIKISFFFFARGMDLEKSTIGMYRSLLVQLLERIPELQRVFESCEISTWNSSSYHQWSVELLKDLFEQAIKMLGQFSVMCFIDALDECDEHEIRDMVNFFQQLGEDAFQANIRFQVCFSSRHYPHISISKGLSLVLEGQEGHSQDITSYINSRLKIGHSKLAEQIRVELQEKAKGVFMWVVLVVDILNKEHDGGRIHALRRRLQDIPGDLHELFRDILMRDYNDRDELLLCIQWLLFAKRPLKPEELYFAVISGSTPQDLSQWDPDEITTDTIKRFITTSSKGLAEITKSKTPRVQFIHESVRDFLLKEDGLSAVWPDLGSNFQGQSHQQLKQGCLDYISIDITTYLKIENPLPKASSPEAAVLRQSAVEAFPFLEYAVQNVFYHADTAEREGVNQKEFLQIFPVTDWINMDNLFEKHEIRRHTPNASLLYILAERNMPNLIKAHPSNLSCFEIEDERYGMPFIAALATGSEEAVRAILKTQAEVQPPTSSLHNLCKYYYQDRNKLPKFTRDFAFSRNKIFHSAAERGDEKLLTFLLATGQFEVNSKDSRGRTALYFAAEGGHDAIFKLLLATDVEFDAKDKDCRTPLWRAAAGGHEAVVKLLLAAGADADAKDKYGRTTLWWAARNGNEAIVKLLLATGQVEVNAKDEDGQTPLWCTAQNGHEAVVKLLLATGAEVDAKDKDGHTPLWRAAQNGHEAVVKLLLATGRVDVNKKNYDETPLWWAANNGKEAIVKLLLATGQAEVDAKDNYGQTPLFRAAQNGYEAVVKLLLATGQVEVNAKDKDGQTPLWRAAQHGHEAVVKLLLATGQVEVNEKDNYDQTPLLRAAQNGHEAVVKLLLATGQVEVNEKDNYDQTPLWRAADNGKEAIVKLLLATGQVEVDAKDEDGQTPLWRAAQNGHEAVVKLLLATGQVEVNEKDNYDQTPLWRAAHNGDEAVVKLLLATGQVEVNAKDKDGQTPLWRAAQNGHEAVVKLLLATGQVEVNEKDNYDQTPLLRAALLGHEAVVKLLLATGQIEVNANDEDGRTLLWHATQNRNKAVVELLLAAGAG